MRNMREVRDVEVYSSMLIGPDALGCIVLFVTPQGHEMPRLGKIPSNVLQTHTPLTTNIMKAGELGVSIGDVRAKTLRLDFIGGDLESITQILNHTTLEMRVSGRRMAFGALRDLPLVFEMPIDIVRYDTFDVRVDIQKNMPASFKPLILRVVAAGVASFDVR